MATVNKTKDRAKIAAPPINLDAIPRELRELPRWVVWRWIVREGKRTKPPFDPTTGRPGDATDPRLWMALDDALAALPGYDGLGFAVSDTPFTGVDLDGCLDEGGTLAPWAEAIVRRLDSYTERTPSGRGLRIWVRGKLPPGRRRKGPVEMYDSARYFTVTGRRFEGTPAAIADRAAELTTLHAEVFPAAELPSAAAAPSVRLPIDLSDDEVLAKAFAARNGHEMAALWQGDTSAFAGDDSAADLALCSKLAFWFGGDLNAIDLAFRRSGLYRAKWERADYRERTLAKAVERDTFYAPPNGNGHHERRAVTSKHDSPPVGNGTVESPASDDQGGETFEFSDLGNARRLAALHGRDLRYCGPMGSWFAWDGTRWAEDQRLEVERMAKDIPDQVLREIPSLAEDELVKAFKRWSLASQSYRKLRDAISLARSEPGIPVVPDQFNREPMVFNCINGTIDLKTGKLRPHDPHDLITKRSPVAYDPDATAPRWERFEKDIFAGNEELIAYTRRLAGYALTGLDEVQEINILHGDGSNGKNVFLEILRHIFGDYGCEAESNLLIVGKSEKHTTGIADLAGRRLVTASETEANQRFAEALVKRLTGDATIKARRMREDNFEFKRTFKLFLATNTKPEIVGSDHGIWRRIRLIPFVVKFVERDQPVAPPLVLPIQAKLKELLAAEAPGILNLLVRGCLDWQRDGMRPPPIVIAATNEYREEMDSIAEFISECCDTYLDRPSMVSEARVSTSALYTAYLAWCDRYGMKERLSSRSLGTALARKGYESRPSNGRHYRHGIGIKQAEHDPSETWGLRGSA